jgi:undecaprenyl-diphosphatase
MSNESSVPSLWHEPAPRQFDLRIPLWVKLALCAAATVLAILFLDQPLAVWARAHPIPNLAYGTGSGGDIARELMWFEQFGQGVCSVTVIAAVALLDRHAGRRRALAIAIGCVLTMLITHLLKDTIGRSRPYVAADDGSWIWGGPTMGFTRKSPWGSCPSAHTTAAFALASGLSWFYPRGRALFMGLALFTAAQRVLHTAHYLSDTITGVVIGVGVMRSALAAKLPGRLIALGPPWARRWWLEGEPAPRA